MRHVYVRHVRVAEEMLDALDQQVERRSNHACDEPQYVDECRADDERNDDSGYPSQRLRHLNRLLPVHNHNPLLPKVLECGGNAGRRVG